MALSAARGVQLRRFFFASASPIVLATTVPAAAQDTANASESEAIVITGSRIQLSPGMSTPVPVTAVTASEIKSMAPGTIVEGLSQLPQFYGNSTTGSQANFFGSGSNGGLNLRGLGNNRTLVLLNGRRMPSSTAFGDVDISNFPEALISNIQTVTGGASAAYGTDAVAGVVNFILDKKFTGLKATFQGGSTTRGDGGNLTVSATYGMNLGSRGHFIVSAEMYQIEGIHDYQGRDWYQGWSTIPNASGQLNIYPNVVSRGLSLDGIIGGVPTNSPLYGLMFNRDGSVSNFVSSSVATGAIGTVGASRQQQTPGTSGADMLAERLTLQPDFERSNIYAYADYEVADNLSVFAQYIRARKAATSFNPNHGNLSGAPTPVTIYAGNPFLPQSIRDIMTANNIASFNLRRMGSIYDVGGNQTYSDNTVLNTGQAGFDWSIHSGRWFDGWEVEGFYQYGRSVRNAYQIGLRVDRIYAAVDAVVDPATGQTVCRVSLTPAGRAAFPGCQPLNLFGAGKASAAAVDYVTGYDPGQTITTKLFFAGQGLSNDTITYQSQEAKVNITTLQQHVAELNFSGQLHKGWGAGPIQLAFGGSYRRESIYQIVQDPGNQTSDHTLGAGRTQNPCAVGQSVGVRGLPAGGDCANTVFIQFSKVSNLNNSIDVKEGYAEMLIPLLADMPLAKALSVDLSARYADYSGSGGVWAYKGGIDWTLGAGLRLRGTYSRDVRAGNLSERYDVTGGTANVTDPRYPNDCNHDGVPGDTTCNITRFSGGNPSVAPEKADTITAGAVYQPTFLPGFSISADWYRIKMKDAISQIGVQAVLNGCQAGNATLCAQVTRDPANDTILLAGDQYINVDQAVISGVDVEASYRKSIRLLGGASESVSGRLFASWLLENSQRLGSQYFDRAGQTGIQQSDGLAYALPRFKLTSSVTYTNGGFSVFTQGRLTGAGYNELNNIVNSAGAVTFDVANIKHNRVPAVYYVDLRIANKFTFGSNRKMEAFVNITNLFDKSPPLTPYWSNFTQATTQTNATLFDILGRRFVVGLKFDL